MPTANLISPPATDPLDFGVADRLPVRDAGHGRLRIGAVPQDGRPGLLFVPVFAIMDRIVVAREEAYLERRFGDAFTQYRSKVRRWL